MEFPSGLRQATFWREGVIGPRLLTGLKILAVTVMGAAGATASYFALFVRPENLVIGKAVLLLLGAVLLYQKWFRDN